MMPKRRTDHLKCTRIIPTAQFSIVIAYKETAGSFYRWKRYLKLGIIHQSKLLIKFESTVKIQ